MSGNRSSVGSSSFNGGGGAIFNASSGTVNITNSTLKFNSADTYSFESRGGGVWNKTGTINVTNSTFDHNQSSYYGGGIWNDAGIITVTGSTFCGNGAILGGGIGSFGGTVSITNSTFYANIAYGFSANFTGFGGAICNAEKSILNLTNSTLTANFSNSGGSGVWNSSSFGATANVKSTIIASNYVGRRVTVVQDQNFQTHESVSESPDVSGTFTSHGFNLIGIKAGSTGFTLATDKKGTVASPLNPKFDLKGLRNNGGPTQTIGLAADSPARDKGTSVGLTGTLTTDQRGAGFPRRVDGSIANATGGDGTDIGAFEKQ